MPKNFTSSAKSVHLPKLILRLALQKVLNRQIVEEMTIKEVQVRNFESQIKKLAASFPFLAAELAKTGPAAIDQVNGFLNDMTAALSVESSLMRGRDRQYRLRFYRYWSRRPLPRKSRYSRSRPRKVAGHHRRLFRFEWQLERAGYRVRAVH